MLALDPMSRTVPTTMTRITANMTAYSAISCPFCSHQSLRTSSIDCSLNFVFLSDRAGTCSQLHETRTAKDFPPNSR